MQETTARPATDWDQYYLQVTPTAKLTRRYTSRMLQKAISMAGGRTGQIVEIGGANSCFADQLLRRFRPSSYHVLDTNEYGLKLLRERFAGQPEVTGSHGDVLHPGAAKPVDVVFSVGLVEHFLPPETRTAVRSHFALAKPGGLVVISFPTPTGLYRMIRSAAESLGIWKFPDERPLLPQEVLAAAEGLGDVLWQKTLWPLGLTQHLIVWRKH